MKEHLCSVEKALINYEGECNWCGEREGGMTQDELIKRLETTCFGLDPIDPLRLLVDDVVAALAQTERTWVGLTDEEIDKILRVYEQDYGWISFAKAIEAKLKELNT
jgi:hypothetical protein